MIKCCLSFLLLALLFSCSDQNKDQSESLSKQSAAAENSEAVTEPGKAVLHFMNWYKSNRKRLGKINLVNNSWPEAYDSTRFYSVNFQNTEKYLSELKSTNCISDKYLSDQREYFIKCDENFKTNPMNDGPPDGFEADLIMRSQEYELDVEEIEKVKLPEQRVIGDKAYVVLEFASAYKLKFNLSKVNEVWLIDEIN